LGHLLPVAPAAIFLKLAVFHDGPNDRVQPRPDIQHLAGQGSTRVSSGKLTFLNFFARKKFRFVALPELTPVCGLVSVLPRVDG
jgi:hypothetical protein